MGDEWKCIKLGGGGCKYSKEYKIVSWWRKLTGLIRCHLHDNFKDQTELYWRNALDSYSEGTRFQSRWAAVCPDIFPKWHGNAVVDSSNVSELGYKLNPWESYKNLLVAQLVRKFWIRRFIYVWRVARHWILSYLILSYRPSHTIFTIRFKMGRSFTARLNVTAVQVTFCVFLHSVHQMKA